MVKYDKEVSNNEAACSLYLLDFLFYKTQLRIWQNVKGVFRNGQRIWLQGKVKEMYVP